MEVKSLFLTSSQVASALGVSKRTVARMVERDPLFPKPVRWNKKLVRWNAGEIERYSQARKGGTAVAHVSTHTYSVLTVSKDTYEEIRLLLEQAGYEHCFHKHGTGGVLEVIDMHGIALQQEPDKCKHSVRVPGKEFVQHKECGATMCRCDHCGRQWCLDHTLNTLTCPGCGRRP